MSGESLRVELGPVSRIVLNRPDKQNAMTADMGKAMERAVESINASSATRVVVVCGEGRAFSAGGDFSLFDQNAQRTPEENRREMRAFYGSFLSLLRLTPPTIAVLQGAAVGAGLCIALACDIRLAARQAKLAANFVRVGLHPGMGCTLLLPHVVGPARARDLILTGRMIDGVEAERIGLVHQAVERDELPKLVDETVEELLRAAPIPAAEAKATLVAPLLASLDAALEREASCQALDFTTQDLLEAVAAFREDRKPVFAGK